MTGSPARCWRELRRGLLSWESPLTCCTDMKAFRAVMIIGLLGWGAAAIAIVLGRGYEESAIIILALMILGVAAVYNAR